MIYFDYIAAFEPEDLVYGDILRSRATGDMFFIVGIEDLEEEVVCIDVAKEKKAMQKAQKKPSVKTAKALEEAKEIQEMLKED